MCNCFYVVIQRFPILFRANVLVSILYMFPMVFAILLGVYLGSHDGFPQVSRFPSRFSFVLEAYVVGVSFVVFRYFLSLYL